MRFEWINFYPIKDDFCDGKSHVVVFHPPFLTLSPQAEITADSPFSLRISSIQKALSRKSVERSPISPVRWPWSRKSRKLTVYWKRIHRSRPAKVSRTLSIANHCDHRHLTGPTWKNRSRTLPPLYWTPRSDCTIWPRKSTNRWIGRGSGATRRKPTGSVSWGPITWKTSASMEWWNHRVFDCPPSFQPFKERSFRIFAVETPAFRRKSWTSS